jgi:surface protein
MSVIGGQNTPTTNGLAYIIDFNNNYISGSSTVTPILYLPTASQFTGSVPNLVNGQVQFTGSSVLRSFQTFPGFSAVQGNMTLMFSGESKNSNVLFTQDGTVAVVSTTSSIGYGVPAGNLGRNFPNTGFDHVTLRFSSASVDCFINGIPVSASGIFPTVPSSSTFNDFKIGGNYINAWTGSFSGSLGQLMVYNRVLTDDEIYSNYLIQARRYGLPEIPKPYTVDSSVYIYTLAAGITGSSTISALNTFVSGLKTAGLWDKMIAIYPFIGTSPSASRLNLKDVSLNTTQVNYSGSWSTSLSGSYNNNTSSYGILSNITPTYVHPLINSQSIHLSYLSYDTPVSGGYLMGTTDQVIATGGEIFDISGSRVHVFTSSANFTVTQGGTVQSLVVAGGGGGGNHSGGGAGGVRYAAQLLTNGIIPVTVGLGGAGGAQGVNGQTSSFGSITSAGGGGGGQFSSAGSNGGSGGGGGTNSGSGNIPPTNPPQGFDGGLALDVFTGAGGGGAGSKGQNGLVNRNVPGAGGSGSFYSQFVGTGYGSPAGWFGGGGGGSSYFGVGQGGIGGGGNGGINNQTGFTTGSPNTGGGGGAKYYQPGTQGGSGIVIISYPIVDSGSTLLYTDPTSVSGSLNSPITGALVTGGPLGLITVTRTGSNSFSLWKNRVPQRLNALRTSSLGYNLYINAANAAGSPISASQNTVAYASVGAGLTDSEVYTYYELVDNLQTSLGRSKSTNPNAFITTWDTRISGTGTVSNTSSIVLPLFGTQAITASWGDGTVSLISSSAQVDRTHSYAIPGVYTVSITGTGQGFQFNNGGDRNKLLDVGQWGSISGSTSAAFYGCTNLKGTAADPQTVSQLASYFRTTGNFNGYINNWNTSDVSDMLYTFGDATAFNQPIGNWDVRNVTRMSNTFLYATSFNQNIGSWNISKVTEAARMFDFSLFNNGGSPSINNWRPISCSDFTSMFANCPFNQPIGNWPISASNINMTSMFNNANSFNQNIGSWDVSRVVNMTAMFRTATGFNNSGSDSIKDWNTANVTSMTQMFQTATSFNQPIGSWNTAKVASMNFMFSEAFSFNQNLGSWLIPSCSNMASMLNSCGMNRANYSATLTGWAAQAPNIQSNVTLGASGRQYDTLGSASRAILTSSPYNWTITGDTYVP